MPDKANANRRHKIPKTHYRVTNWPDYDAALVQRGSLTLRAGLPIKHRLFPPLAPGQNFAFPEVIDSDGAN